MKSAQRHELQKNELADWLGEHIEAAKPHAGMILVGVLAVVTLIVLVIYFSSGTGTTGASAWNNYFEALGDREPVAALEQVAKNDAGTSAGLWAKQSLGDINAARGAMQLFSDRDEAKKSLEAAEKAYKEVEAAATDELLKARSRLGLAKVYESQNKPEEAKKYYELVAELGKDSAIGKLGQEGASRMSDPREIETLAWFAKQTPPKPAGMPGMGTGPRRLPDDLPERPDLSLPGLGTGGPDLDLEGLGTGKPETPGLEFPAPGENKPAESPATESPAPESPSSGEAPKP
jgi:tetratricopeptide (TPR) repeat protein